jgi:hypothetical protein
VQGEVIEDTYALYLPSGMPAGTYSVEVGMYDSVKGERLEVTDASGQPHDDGILLGSVIVVP